MFYAYRAPSAFDMLVPALFAGALARCPQGGCGAPESAHYSPTDAPADAQAPEAAPAVTRVRPRSRVATTDAGIAFAIELPGVPAGDVEVEIAADRTLRVTAGVATATAAESALDRRAFEFAARLPADIARDGVSAKLENGLLRVTVPRATAHEATKVEVK
eukprot:gnl/Ergobibamus_cyprinoides/935.p1 GENE.gnl/Ergobibamus_cyprinoides/935~~gnl/Ergobibamus_cyprinoides/935.p1  ORF type:complete len:176 (+),score=72.19 gnl/Ergobibamus_cyprinoides/935:46-528(+)